MTSISIYPNPTSNVLNFKGLNSDFTVSIYDILGKEILQADLNVDQLLDVSHMASGVYILTLNDQKKTFKFVKE
ncbi:MAG: T9SS type A sorting domain-containing protein [Flavobacteriaceae bacterium]|nr:T9SS type A sorting domain-containing protein [Flavobacteriaceae bacterium]